MTTTISVSIEELYREYHDKIFYRCYFMVHNQQIAEDLTQDTFLRAWQGYKHADNLNAWLLTIATHACIDFLRKQHMHISIDSEEITELPEMSDPYEACAEHELIDKTLARLLPDERTILARWLDDKHSVHEERMAVLRARREFMQAYREVESEVEICS